MHMRVDFFAETLGLSTSMTVLLPQRAEGQIGMSGAVRERTPVLYLLHGRSDDDTIWTRRTSIERYAADLGLAVVMPAVNTSFYCDEVHGKAYWQFVSEELPTLVADSFNVSDRREDTFVAGLSMGGFGAFKLALNHPARFAAAGSMSGAIDMVQRHALFQADSLIEDVWGGKDIAGTLDDLVHLVGTADPATLPRLWLSCGTEDFLVEENRRFLQAAASNNVLATSEFPPGGHEWSYWDSAIQRFLAFTGLSSATD